MATSSSSCRRGKKLLYSSCACKCFRSLPQPCVHEETASGVSSKCCIIFFSCTMWMSLWSPAASSHVNEAGPSVSEQQPIQSSRIASCIASAASAHIAAFANIWTSTCFEVGARTLLSMPTRAFRLSPQDERHRMRAEIIPHSFGFGPGLHSTTSNQQ